jgi:Ca-activated chloride channel homolog
MNRTKLILFFVGMLIILFNFMPDQPPSPPSGKASVTPAPTQTPVPAQTAVNTANYSMRPTDNKWPTMQDTKSAVDNNLVKKNYYLVFDGSGSMNEVNCSNGKAKIAVAKQSVTQFISKIPTDANIGLAIFDNNGVYEGAKLGQSSKQQAIEQINHATAGGGTPLNAVIDHAYKSLSQQAQKQLGYGEYHLVVVTDGVASNGQDPSDTVQKLIQESPVVLHTIGFCIAGNHSLNQAGVTIYKSANNPTELARGLESVLAEVDDFNVNSFQDQ